VRVAVDARRPRTYKLTRAAVYKQRFLDVALD
jgi:hypothetical protein